MRFGKLASLLCAVPQAVSAIERRDIENDGLLSIRLSQNADSELALQLAIEPSEYPCGHAAVNLNDVGLPRTAKTRLTIPASPSTTDRRTTLKHVTATADFKCNHDPVTFLPQSETLTVTIQDAVYSVVESGEEKELALQNSVFKVLIDARASRKIVQVLGSDLVMAVPKGDDGVEVFATAHQPGLQQTLLELEMMRAERDRLDKTIEEFERYVGGLTSDVMCPEEVSTPAVVPEETTPECHDIQCLVDSVTSQAKHVLDNFLSSTPPPPPPASSPRLSCHFPFSGPGLLDKPTVPAWPPAFCRALSAGTSQSISITTHVHSAPEMPTSRWARLSDTGRIGVLMCAGALFVVCIHHVKMCFRRENKDDSPRTGCRRGRCRSQSRSRSRRPRGPIGRAVRSFFGLTDNIVDDEYAKTPSEADLEAGDYYPHHVTWESRPPSYRTTASVYSFGVQSEAEDGRSEEDRESFVEKRRRTVSFSSDVSVATSADCSMEDSLKEMQDVVGGILGEEEHEKEDSLPRYDSA